MIMGGGKSSAAITYINEHPEKRFIYITPYLDEAERIKVACPAASFVEPSNKIAEYQFTKSNHTAALIHEGRNITSTHSAFMRYTPQMLEEIAAFQYELIIDESLGCTGEYQIHQRDLQLVAESGLLEIDGDAWCITDEGLRYDGKKFADLMSILSARRLISVDDRSNGKTAFFWVISPELLRAFNDVLILTYLFDGQEMKYYLDANRIEYQHIGVERDGNGVYRFRETTCPPPSYTKELAGLIHIDEHDKLNSIGESEHALSMSWMERNGDEVDQLRRHTYNFFRGIHDDIPAEKRLWGSYESARAKLRGRGYSGAYLPFNARATNAYADRNCLAYLVNIYPNVSKKNLYHEYGIEIDDDAYALSFMVQWIWRSAIRNGKAIDLYLPSGRMKRLLNEWVASLKDGAAG